jgi:hypothetical protein
LTLFSSELQRTAIAFERNLLRGPEQDDVVGVIGDAFDLHARGSDRHAGNRKPLCIGFLRKQALYRIRRNMTLNHIATDFSGVTGSKILRDAEARLYPIDLGSRDDLYREAGCPHVIHPAAATTAARIFDDEKFRQGRLCKRLSSYKDCAGGTEYFKKSATMKHEIFLLRVGV